MTVVPIKMDGSGRATWRGPSFPSRDRRWQPWNPAWL